MFLNFITIFILKIPLISQSQIVIGLSIIVFFFLILLILGVRKSYLLKKENDRLNKMSELHDEEEKNRKYKDFTEGHMYDNK